MKTAGVLCTVSALALLTAGALPASAQTAGAADQPVTSPAQGPGTAAADQTTTPDSPGGGGAGDELIVTGVRASLRSAQTIKRNSAQVVDSIVAEDIGKLPDNTVSDALQRVTGIQVSRSAGEVGTVLVRGLPDIETLINGRETFTGTGRGVALQDIPAELVAGIDVYKTNLPEQIEGSVSGTIDIRLRRPFDFSGAQVAGSVRGIYSDQRNEASYIASGLISNRWQTTIGEVGVLLAASYNKRKYQDQTAFNFGFGPQAPPSTDPTLIPDTVGGLVTNGDRTRPALSASVQWRPSENLEFYADGLYTGYRQDYDVDFFVGLPKAGGVTVTSVQPGTVNYQGAEHPVAHTITTLDNFTISSKQTFHQKTDGFQGNIGSRWTKNNWVLNGEFTYNDSKVISQQYVVDTAYVVPRIDYNFDVDGTPHLDFNGFNFRDPSILNFLTLFDNRNEATSRQYAVHGDALYNFDNSVLKSVKFGVRYARRTGDSAGTNPAGYGIPFVRADQYPGFSTNASDDIIGGKLGVDGFALTSSDWIRDNIDLLRGLANRPTGEPAFDPAQVFSLKEKTLAGYAQVNFGFDAGSVPIEATAGMRVVNTKTNLNAVLVTNPGQILTPIVGDRNETDWLPSISIKAHATDNLILRAVAGRAILRPQFASLNPALSLTPTGGTGNQTYFGTGSGGNADLRDVKSTNVDLTAEWYFTPTGSLTVAGFYKRLDGYIQSYAAKEQQTAADGTIQDFLITRPRNTDKGTLKGVEVAYTQFFDMLPGALSGLGAQVSGTYSNGQVQDPIHQGLTQQITPLSKWSYNLVGIYEKYGLSMRLAYNWRSKYVDSYSDAFAGGKVEVDPLGFLDFSASYALTSAVTLTFDATNITGETYHDHFGTSGYEPRDTRSYDRTFGGGIRFRF